ncbi:MAG: OmpA family protein [Nitrospirae bacterium]|nr:OmpA family protein [Nitrospirota bacterium]
MRKPSTTFTLLGVVGMALIVSQGCGEKSHLFSTGDESGEQGQHSQYAEGDIDRSNPWPHSENGMRPDGTYAPGEYPNGASESESSHPGANNPALAQLSENGEGHSAGGQGPGEHDWKNGPLAGLQELGQQGQGYSYDPFTGQSAIPEERVTDRFAFSGAAQQGAGSSWGGPDGQYQANAQGGHEGGTGIQPFYNGQGEAPFQMYQEGAYDENGVRVELQDVFFEYDSWRITQEGTQALAHDAEWLGENQERSLMVEGHCDQRGSQNYNLVLGKKRAEAVRSYLIDLGVESSQVQVISFGEERPFCMGSNDRCMQLNRRGHLALHKN